MALTQLREGQILPDALFKSDLASVKDDSTSTTSDPAWSTKVSITINSAGETYALFYYIEGASGNNDKVGVRITVNGLSYVSTTTLITNDTNTWFNACSGFDVLALAPGTRLIELQYSSPSGGSVNVRRGRLFVIRI